MASPDSSSSILGAAVGAGVLHARAADGAARAAATAAFLDAVAAVGSVGSLPGPCRLIALSATADAQAWSRDAAADGGRAAGLHGEFSNWGTALSKWSNFSSLARSRVLVPPSPAEAGNRAYKDCMGEKAVCQYDPRCLVIDFLSGTGAQEMTAGAPVSRRVARKTQKRCIQHQITHGTGSELASSVSVTLSQTLAHLS